MHQGWKRWILMTEAAVVMLAGPALASGPARLSTSGAFLDLVGTPEVIESVAMSNSLDPGEGLIWRLFVDVQPDDPLALLQFPVIEFDLPVDFTFVDYHTDRGGLPPRSPDFDCVGSGTLVRCSALDANPLDFVTITVEASAPEDSRGRLVEPARARLLKDGIVLGEVESEPYVLFRTLDVLRADDSGEGTLRDAILRANDECPVAFSEGIPCKIRFQAPAEERIIIRPENPLPRVTAPNLTIDGGGYVSPPHGLPTDQFAAPRVEIDGSRLTDGDGIVFASTCRSGVIGLSIGGFPNNGILILSEPCHEAGFFRHLRTFEGSFLGVRPDGSPNPNGLRGIAVHAPVFRVPVASVVVSHHDDEPRELLPALAGVRIANNVIAGNIRSGVFIWSGNGVDVIGNRIGVNHRGEAVGNGASGVYVGYNGLNVDLISNTIANNAHWGLAVNRGARWVQVGDGNSIHSNNHLGIDHGLDLATPNQDRDGIPDRPVLVSATYDPIDDRTVVRGVMTVSESNTERRAWRLRTYASRPESGGRADGEIEVGPDNILYQPGDSIEVVIAGDFTGWWITATATEEIAPTDFSSPFLYDTSEFSNAVRVAR